jgi:hypothetical protein
MSAMISKTWYANIWIGGDHAQAIKTCREFCMEGLCVTVTPTSFVYTGGMEEGVCVRLIQYPRFPRPERELMGVAIRLADALRMTLYQHSFTIETPDETHFFSARPEGNVVK